MPKGLIQYVVLLLCYLCHLFYVFLLGVGEDTFDRDDVRQSQLATVNIHNLCVPPQHEVSIK